MEWKWWDNNFKKKRCYLWPFKTPYIFFCNYSKLQAHVFLHSIRGERFSWSYEIMVLRYQVVRSIQGLHGADVCNWGGSIHGRHSGCAHHGMEFEAALTWGNMHATCTLLQVFVVYHHDWLSFSFHCWPFSLRRGTTIERSSRVSLTKMFFFLEY